MTVSPSAVRKPEPSAFAELHGETSLAAGSVVRRISKLDRFLPLCALISNTPAHAEPTHV
jgi:hypothetical protein